MNNNYAAPKDAEDLGAAGSRPSALSLAIMLVHTMEIPLHGQAADELRRLHAENEQLKAQPQTMRPAELAERLKRGEKWAVGQEQPAQQEPVLFIHPSTLEMASAHVGAWKPGHELPGYIALYAAPPQPAHDIKERP